MKGSINFSETKYVSLDVNVLSAMDRSFKISRTVPSDEFLVSVAKDGVLDPPLLLGSDSGAEVLFGFNRIDASAGAGVDRLTCLRADSVSADEYASMLTLKFFRGEAGPIGRLRAVEIMLKKFNADIDSIAAFARGRWGIPDEFFFNRNLSSKALSFGTSLSSYLDSRDIGYKTIRILAGMPLEQADLLGEWASKCSMRVNIFKSSVEMGYEIFKRDGAESFNKLAGALPESAGEMEGVIFNSLTRLRYPEHERLAERVNAAVKKISSMGITADFPLRTENDYVALTMRLGRRRGLDDAIKNLEKAAPDIDELLNLL